MKANRAYRLIVTREGRGPAFLAEPDRLDHVEVVGVDDGEVVFFWDLDPRAAKRLARRLREDLSMMDAETFVEAWREA